MTGIDLFVSEKVVNKICDYIRNHESIKDFSEENIYKIDMMSLGIWVNDKFFIPYHEITINIS